MSLDHQILSANSMTLAIDQFARRFGDVREAVTVGVLRVRSKELVAFDPTFSAGAEHFEQPIPSGDYEVRLAAGAKQRGREPAFAEIIVDAEAAVARWRLGLRAGAVEAVEDPGDMREDGPVDLFDSARARFAVSAGVAAFADGAALPALGALLVSRAEEDPMSNPLDLFQELVRAPRIKGPRLFRPTWIAGSLQPDPDQPSTIVYFQTGARQGRFATYFGYAGNGRLARVVVDFDR